MSLLWALDSFLLGALGGLWLVNRHLHDQMAIYGAEQMDEVSVILDLLDDLIPYNAITALSLAGLLLLTGIAWAWRRGSQRRLDQA